MPSFFFIFYIMATQADVTNFSGTEIITLDEAKAYLRVDFTTDNNYITELIKIARLRKE